MNVSRNITASDDVIGRQRRVQARTMMWSTGMKNATLFHRRRWEAGTQSTTGCSRYLLTHRTPTYPATIKHIHI